MAAPNIVNVATITAKTVTVTPASTAANTILSNAASSGKVLKVNMVMAANIDGSNAVNATVYYNSAAAGGGSSSALVSTVSVPATASLIASDKSTAFYLEEDKSLVVQTGTASKMAFTVSYEELS